MIKEIFDIEPRQKNLLIILFAITSLSFLQIYLFSPATFDKGAFTVIGLSLALMICWSIMNLPSLFFCYLFLDEEADITTKIDLKQIFFFGLIAIAWITVLTYASYELNLSFKWFIRVSIGISILRTALWFILVQIRNKNNT